VNALAHQRTVIQPLAADFAQGAPAGQGALPPGTLLNSIYEVRGFLARGGMGEVYEGVNVNTDERVAIKVMLPHLAANPKVQAMFRKEARILTELAHPALVRYRVLAQEPQLGLFYIVTEFIDGASLADALPELKPTVAELEALTRRLAGGLAAAHALGAVHRDMSPDNVLLPGGRLDQAKIIDFGIARESAVSQQTVVGDSFAGKLGFVAPEQFGDFGRRVGAWTDVYSLGLVVLAVAAGKAPDMGHTLVDAVDRRREGVDLSPLPAALKPIFEKMLAPNPSDRFQTMEEVIAALDRPPAAKPAEPAPQAPAAPAPKPAAEAEAPQRRSRMPLLVAGGAVVALAGGFVLALGGGPSKPASVVVPVAAPITAPALADVPEAVPLAEPVETLTENPAAAAPALPAAAKPRQARQPRQGAAPSPAVAYAAAPVAQPAAPRPAEAQPAQTAAPVSAAPAQATVSKDSQACWRANGSSWSFVGYANRASCAAQAFEGHCQVVHGRWGKDQLRRYDGKIQVKGTGPLARWRAIAPSTCPDPSAAAR
jgi:serine/threonine-protein kinase